MRLVHTSDWHLGRSFHQVGLLDAQAQFVDFLVELVRAERADAVLVSGDVYDRALPTPETVTLLSEALVRLVDAGAQVVLTSGNHDSVARLAFAGPLLSRAGVHIRAEADGLGDPVIVDGVAIYPLPYLEPALAAGPLAATERTHAAVLRAAMAHVRADQERRGLPTVVMAHAFVAGAAASQSERDIAIGGVSVVPAEVFAGSAYAALGHLHRPQVVRDQVVYCGSPVAMSFGEADHTKSVALVDLDVSGAVALEMVPTPVPRRLAVIRGDLETILADPTWAWAEQAWCQVVLTDPVRPLGAFERLKRRLPHLLALDFEPRGGQVLSVQRYATRTRSGRSELDVCCDFLAHVRGGAGPDPAERADLRAALEATRVDRGSHDDEGGLLTDRRAGVA